MLRHRIFPVLLSLSLPILAIGAEEKLIGFEVAVKTVDPTLKQRLLITETQIASQGILQQLKWALDSQTGVKKCKSYLLCPKAPPTLWKACLKLLDVQVDPKYSSARELWNPETSWETAFTWWNPAHGYRQRFQRTDDLTLEHTETEHLLKEAIETSGKHAGDIYPRNKFYGFRWSRSRIPEGKTAVIPSGRFVHALKERVATTPELIYQIVKRDELPGDESGDSQPSLFPETNPYHRNMVFQMENKDVISVDYFLLPPGLISDR